MNILDNEIKNVINTALDGQETSVEFESTWIIANKNKRDFFLTRKKILIPIITTITIIALFTVGYAGYPIFRNIDRIDYTYVEDSRVIGKWTSVDIVEEIDIFEPDKKSTNADIYLKSLAFINGGEMLAALQNDYLEPTPCNWTKDLVLDKIDKTASKYIIKNINGIPYMFLEWRSGDYVFESKKPKYYVLKKTDSLDYSSYDLEAVKGIDNSNNHLKAVKEDKVDYPFVNDPQIIGKWESVDLLRNAEVFIPGRKNYNYPIHIISFNFMPDGEMAVTTRTPESSKRFKSVWTKGMVLFKTGDKVACKYEIKNIDGTAYMFYEFKNGDYVYDGLDPSTVVLKKIDK